MLNWGCVAWGPVGLEVLVAFGLILILVVYTVLITVVFRQYERKFVLANAKREGRFIDWRETQAKLANGVGILCYHHYFGMVYWIPVPISEEELENKLTENKITELGFMTDCPRRFRSPKHLRKAFPNVTVLEIFGLTSGSAG